VPMTTLSVDASNCCIPLTSPILHLSPPLPSTTRGEPTVLDGRPGRINNDRSILLYGSGKLVIVRDFSKDGGSNSFVYRGHMANVTCAKFSPSGSYIASADVRGKLRVWSWDNELHLCKLDLAVLSGPIRSIAWDFDSKRVSLETSIVKHVLKFENISPFLLLM
jgi:WD repeat-containing protein 1 (actin-interacting protein 1)